MSNQNLFVALRAAFPADLDAVAVETDNGLCYSWRDLDRASAAMVANLLASLPIAGRQRCAARGGAGGKSVEAMILYLATLRAGFVFLPLNTAYQSAEIEYFIGNAQPAVVVVQPQATSAGSARSRSGRHAPRVHAGRRPQRQPAGARRAVQRPQQSGEAFGPTTWRPSSTPAAPPGAARAPCCRTATCCPMP